MEQVAAGRRRRDVSERLRWRGVLPLVGVVPLRLMRGVAVAMTLC